MVRPEIIHEFQKRKHRQLYLVAPITVIVFILFDVMKDSAGSSFGLSKNTSVILTALILITVFSFSVRNWRCPACDTYLGKMLNPKHCPHCGIKLQMS
jgi:hypothetical protein